MFIPLVPVSVAVIATVMAGHDLGTAMILVLIVLGALFFSGVKLRIFILPLIGAAVTVAYLAVTSPNRMRRILSFMDPDCDYFNECYQPLHGVWGLAGGGVFGLGLGNSKEKYDWLPAAANDYIFAIVGEELGLDAALEYVYTFTYHAAYEDKGSEHEVCSVFLGRVQGEIVTNENEIAAVRWIAPEALDAELAAAPDDYSPWLHMEWARLRDEFAGVLARYTSA